MATLFKIIFTTIAILGVTAGQIANLDEVVKDFKSTKVSEWSNDLDTWEAPYEVREMFPYYFSGYDYEKRPVVVWEIGKWDIRKYVDGNEEAVKIMTKYVEQVWFRMQNLTSPFPEAEEGVTLIIDSDKFSGAQLTSVDVIRIQLTMGRFADKVEPYISRIFCINMSFVAETWFNLIRSIAGRLAGRMETFGPNASKWMPALANAVPRDQLPPWYGGKLKPEEYKPIKVWG